MHLLCFLALFVFLGCPAQGLALDRFDIVTTEELERLLTERQAGQADFLLVNTLDELVYRHSSIPGSINVPWSKVRAYSDRLGENKDRLLITYWMGYRWVFAYKTAVAVKALGYRNIKIYNGGIKDWEKSGHSLESIQRLPDYKCSFIGVDELLQRLSAPNACKSADGKPALTILDLRTEYHVDTEELETGQPVVLVATDCPVIHCLLDDLQRPEVREMIPRQGPVVTLTETGNRDQFAIQYLSAYGFSNILGLEFGMRNWIKAGYPTKTLEPSQRPNSVEQ